jgi:hypothetical protein
MAMDNDTSDFDSTFFICECALCRQPLKPQGADLFFAVSSSHPNPEPAVWKEDERLLYVGSTKASMVCRSGEVPGVYLVHRCCSDIIMASNCRPLFDCLRALGPVLNESPTQLRSWPWLSSCATYAPVLRAIFSRTDADLETVQRKIGIRLTIFKRTMNWLPCELLEMVIDHIPLELAISLDYFSGRGISLCLHRIRQDTVASRLERASQVLRHNARQVERHHRTIRLEEKMVARFLEVSELWYLQDLYPDEKQEEAQTERFKQLPFTHDHNRIPYIAIQVNEFGITHVGFQLEAGKVKWISPNKDNGRADFFQDTGGAEQYDSVSVLSDVRRKHPLISF